jgi:hypothetical protein
MHDNKMGFEGTQGQDIAEALGRISHFLAYARKRERE